MLSGNPFTKCFHLLTKCFLWFNQLKDNLCETREFFKELGYFVMARSNHASSIYRHDQISETHLWEQCYGAHLPDPFDEGKPRPIISDGQTKRDLLLAHDDFLGVSLGVGVDEILQTYLGAKEGSHVDLVSVEGTKYNLE